MKQRTKITICLSCVCCGLWVGCWPGTFGAGGDAVSVTGTLDASAVGKGAPNALEVHEGYTVMAQSSQTGEIYRTTTGADGAFQLDIPASEANNAMLFSILDATGKAMGPVLLGQAGENGITGANLDGESESLGHIVLPVDLSQAPIRPGNDATLGDQTNPDLLARLDAQGVPVGVPNVGKGQTALFPGAPALGGLDRDQDGLIDLVDADDDGDGVVDDFDGDGGDPGAGEANFFMNLKISSEQATTYYNGPSAEIDARLATDTVITMEVLNNAFAGKTITGVRALTSPAPSYLATAQKMSTGGVALAYAPWSDTGYGFDSAGDRWQAFIVPGAVMNAGDLFTVEVSFDDGTTALVSRMVNYVFKNIPKLTQYGSTGAMSTFDVTGAAVNGTQQKPIPFDGTQDLVLTFEPPIDETGAAITGLDYNFEIFYQDATGGQLNESIDAAATWTSSISNWDAERTVYSVSASALTLSGGTYTVTLPKEILPSTVTTGSGNVAVNQYKIDIAAQKNGNNAAIMLVYQKS